MTGSCRLGDSQSADRHQEDTSEEGVSSKPGLQVLRFTLAVREFGFPLSSVTEILPIVAVTPVTGSPDWLTGVINRRGSTLTVIDLRRRLGFPPVDHDLHAAIVVVQPTDRDNVGFIVDRVSEVTSIPDGAFDQVDPLGGDEHPVQGLGRIGEKMIVILDVDRLMAERHELTLPATLR